MNIFKNYLENLNKYIGYNILVTKDNINQYIAKDGKLTINKNEAFLFTDEVAINLKQKEFETQYVNLGYKLHYIKVYEDREANSE